MSTNKIAKLLVILSLAIAPIGFLMAIPNAAEASPTTNKQWKQYFSGRKIVEFSRYSSGYGGGGMTSQKSLNFCGDGRLALLTSGSMVVNGGDLTASSSGGNQFDGNWRIVDSNQYQVVVELTDASTGQKGKFGYAMGQDSRLYTTDGNKLLTGPSEFCQGS